MRSPRSNVRMLHPNSASAAMCSRGHVVALMDDGQVLVDWPGNESRATLARTVVSTSDTLLPGTPVLLGFEQGDLSLPVVLGLLRDTVLAPPVAPPTTLE